MIVVWGAVRLRAEAMPRPGRLDVPGFLLSALGLGLLIGGVSETTTRGWSDPLALGAAASGIVALVGLVAVERRASRPLIDLRSFRHRLFTAATGLYALGSVAYIGALYLVTAFLQEALGLSALTTGLTSVASAVGVVLGGQLVTRVLYARFGPRRLVAVGLVASPIFTASEQLGSAVGVALLATVVAVTAHGSPAAGGTPSLLAYHVAFIVAAAIALLSVAVAVTIHHHDAAATMQRRERSGAAGADRRIASLRHVRRL